MNAFDLPRRRSGRRANLVPVPDPHQPAAVGFSDPAPVQFTDARLAAIEMDVAWLRRVLERFTAGTSADPRSSGYVGPAPDTGYDTGYGHPGWADEPAEPAWHADPDATLAGQVPAADLTMPDQRAQMARPYAPESEPVPVITDMAALPLFRDAVRSRFVRSEPHHGCPQHDAIESAGQLRWPLRYAVLYQHRTGAVPEPDLGIDELFGPRVTARSAS